MIDRYLMNDLFRKEKFEPKFDKAKLDLEVAKYRKQKIATCVHDIAAYYMYITR
jgi:hypothetical protein